MSVSWYVIHSHPRKEDALYQQLLATGVEAFYPHLIVRPVNPRSKKIVPYFPGYLFIHVDLQVVPLITFQRTPHAVGLVTFGDEPPIVSDNLVYGIRQYLESMGYRRPDDPSRLKKGDSVIVLAGPFAQYSGIFDVHLTGSNRARILLKMLNSRDLPIEIDLSQIAKR